MTERHVDPTVMSADTPKYPRPTRVLTKKALLAAWRRSRDDSNKPGAIGVDGISGRQFKLNLDANISRILRDVKTGSYRFSRLRPFFIFKKNGKKRVICVPTVSDRLVQRTIVQHISTNDRLKLLNEVSYGFVSGDEKGVQSAIKKAMHLRAQHEWVLKTDIQSFFDDIDRPLLKKKIERRLGHSSLVPLLLAAVDSEIRTTSQSDRTELAALGIRTGWGLRQGMPLSPLLSNFVLSEFDQAAIGSSRKILRYADDLILFGNSKFEIEDGLQFIVRELGKVKHTVPLPGPGSKTEYVTPKMAVEFLGLEIVHKEIEGRYVCRIPKSARSRILADIADKGSLQSSLKDRLTFEGACRRLASLPSSYRSAYRQAEDWSGFEPQVIQACNKALTQIFVEIFGAAAISGLTAEVQKFLGILAVPDE